MLLLMLLMFIFVGMLSDTINVVWTRDFAADGDTKVCAVADLCWNGRVGRGGSNGCTGALVDVDGDGCSDGNIGGGGGGGGIFIFGGITGKTGGGSVFLRAGTLGAFGTFGLGGTIGFKDGPAG